MAFPTIAIVGAGSVGATTAYALTLHNIPAHIVLIDVDATRCAGEIMDLEDAFPLYHTGRISHATLTALETADIIIIAAGARQQPGQSRAQLVNTNKEIISSILHAAPQLPSHALIIMVSNPLDTLVYHAQKISGLPHAQVFGTGTFLDTLRMRTLIAHELSVDPSSVHAFVLGEHGDHQFPAWSSAEVGGKPLTAFAQLSPQRLASIAQQTREKAYQIIACKGATYYGIASCIAHICHTILSDEHLVLPLSCYQERFGLYLSMPAILTRQGIKQNIDIPLNQHEQAQLMTCVQALKSLVG